MGSLLLASCGNKEATLDTERLNAYFDALDGRYMGTVVINKGGRTVFERSLGYADVEAGVKADASSKYMVGSISKVFTSSMVMMAAEEGLLSLDDNLEKYFPGANIPNAATITLDDLLYHRSGLTDIFEGEGDYLQWYTSLQSREQQLQRIAAEPADTVPGAVQKYCNAGYVLMSYILEDVYGMSYADLLQQKIASPLGLNQTAFADRIEVEKGECRSYAYKGGWDLQPETDPSVPMGAGSVMSTPADLVKFGDALFHGTLGSSVLDSMERIAGSLGRGLFPFVYYDKKGFGHTGGIDGFQSVMCHFDDGDVTLALCSNGSDLNQNDILIVLLSAMYDHEYDIPSFANTTVDASLLEQYAGTYYCEALKMTLNITTDGKTLTGQVVGQTAFPLEAASDTRFECARGGIVIELSDAGLTLLQAGYSFLFVKQ